MCGDQVGECFVSFRGGKQNGFTLIEIIVAMSVLAIVVVAFSTLFTTGFSGIFSAGDRSVAQYIGQEAAENIMAGVDYVHSDVSISWQSQPVELFFSDGTTLTVRGAVYELEYSDGKQIVRLTTFVPAE